MKSPLPILALLLAPLTAAADSSWYVGGSVGEARSDVDSKEVTSRLADQGLSGSARVEHTDRLGWRLFGGYEWNPYLALEAGYTDLGEMNATLTGTGAVTADQLKAIRPASGSGYEMALLGKYPFTPHLAAFARAGLFHWQAKDSVSGGGSATSSGNDPFVGIGAELKLNSAWSARLSWDRYAVDQDTTSLLAFGLVYRLQRASTAPIASVQAPAPETPPAPAVAPEPPVAPAPPSPPVVAAEEPVPAAPRKWALQFAFGSTTPLESEPAIQAAAEDLAAHQGSHAWVTGHTDSSGPEVYNPYLARLRAEAVADALVAQGVDRSRITLESKGASEPVADNKTRAGRTKNRRAEILIREGD